MCLTVGLWVHPTWNSLSFLAFFMIFCQVGDISVIISSYNLPAPSSPSSPSSIPLSVCVGPFDGVPKVP